MVANVMEAKARTYSIYNWKVEVGQLDGALSLSYKGKPVIQNSVARWSVEGDTLALSDCVGLTVSLKNFRGVLGKQKTLTLAAMSGDLTAIQEVNFYPGKDFVTTRLSLSSTDTVSTRYLAPVCVTKRFRAFVQTGNHAIFVPYDNDAWVRYGNTPFGDAIPESYEVTALVNAGSREAIIIGSVEHDVWKTGVKVAASEDCSIDTLIAYGGASSSLTRDIIPHGMVKGKVVKSSLILIGRADDWRDGMEEFADVCATIAPKIESLGGRPFGWNSWGKLQTEISYDKAVEVSDFFKTELQNRSFENDGVVYIGLDSFWDYGFNSEQHRQFVEYCKSQNQKAGIYYCPFTDWGKNPEATFGEMPRYRYRDAYLYGDGKIIEYDGAYALDPTHPAVKARIKRQLREFIDWGYEYVKIDFMGHGACEADRHFDPSVTTGIQAYNHGLKYIDDVVGGKLWINLSIAPLFPGNYAHSRRIGCDAWADINNTEYTLNALTYGWWLDHVYHYNDADHIVMEGVSEGENRARVTSSAITGVYLLGDDLSENGDMGVKSRVRDFIANPAINLMARECKSFRPVELGEADKAADTFCYRTADFMYVAMFNFSDSTVRKVVPMSRLGLSVIGRHDAVELWSSSKMSILETMSVDIPPKDVKVLKIRISK